MDNNSSGGDGSFQSGARDHNMILWIAIVIGVLVLLAGAWFVYTDTAPVQSVRNIISIKLPRPSPRRAPQPVPVPAPTPVPTPKPAPPAVPSFAPTPVAFVPAPPSLEPGRTPQQKPPPRRFIRGMRDTIKNTATNIVKGTVGGKVIGRLANQVGKLKNPDKNKPMQSPAKTSPTLSTGSVKLNPQGNTGDLKIPTPPPLPETAKPPAGAIVGTTLKKFEFVESMVHPAKAAPEINNITQVAPGVTMHALRFRGKWNDGDRNLHHSYYTHKARAEMYGLGGDKPYKLGETWLIGTTLYLAPDFVPSKGYCNTQQPVLHQSYFNWHTINGDKVTGSLMVFEAGLGSGTKEVRRVTVRRGEWNTFVTRVTFGEKGAYALSMNGDDFEGIKINTSVGHIHKNKVGKVKEFGGTWGLYMSTYGGKDGKPQKDTIVLHANPWIKKIG